MDNDLAKFDVSKTNQLKDDITRMDNDLNNQLKLKGKVIDIQSKLADLQELKSRYKSTIESTEEDSENLKANGKLLLYSTF